MNVKHITSYLEDIFPLELQLGFDNCGLQVGNIDKDITKVLVSLNMDEFVIDKAIEQNCQMIISHHPLMIQPIKNFNLLNPTVKIIEKAMKHNIVIYSLHTCLDQGKDGISMNDWLINLFDCHTILNYDDLKIGKMAILNKPSILNNFIKDIKDILSLEQIKFSGNKNKEITTFAICGGSASDDIYKLANKVDAFITGDCKYHQGQFAIENNIALIDVGHHIEVIVEKKLKELLSTLDIEVIEAKCKDYFEYE